MAQTSRPDRTRSLPNLNLKSCYEYFRVPPSFDLGWVRRLEEEFDRFLQVCASGLDGVALARNIELGTKSNVSVALALNNRCQLLSLFHGDPFLVSF
jgi:hypothetical protein